MYKAFLSLFILIVSLLSFNCATVFKGYEDTITLTDAPDSIRVVTSEGVEIPIENKIIRVYQKGSYVFADKTIKEISLRSNKDYTLHLKYLNKEKIVFLYPKIGFWWSLLDFICGGLPSFYDAYTGNWNHFPNVDASF